MDILENKTAWQDHFRQNWLAELKQTGTTNWKIYQHPRNEHAPGAPGIKLSESRLMLITSAGAYLRDEQQPFDEPNLYGDYTLRTFPATTPFSALAYAHGHYDPTMVQQDAQVGIPLRHLEEFVTTRQLGELAPRVVSFMGYQPDSAKTVDDFIPHVVALAKEQAVHAALLAPM
ncbi:MAG TPA: glycine/sarcosine/betaine reductase selenoprotein B family protein [Anaerolineales bacterium]|nr:glycine/sarcosine/betaine reductase selenoprotein B family protein [Anaerolineales bacterium]